MPEVTIKYKGKKAFKALQDLAKVFDLVIKQQEESQQQQRLPIRFSKNPDANSLSGIWKDKPVTIEALRKKAWGDRL